MNIEYVIHLPYSSRIVLEVIGSFHFGFCNVDDERVIIPFCAQAVEKCENYPPPPGWSITVTEKSVMMSHAGSRNASTYTETLLIRGYSPSLTTVNYRLSSTSSSLFHRFTLFLTRKTRRNRVLSLLSRISQECSRVEFYQKHRNRWPSYT
jgi:hypothetical protein